MAAYRGGGHVAVAELEDIADEHVVGVDRVVKALGAREQQIAAAAEQAVLHLIVDIGYQTVAGGLDHGEVEVYLLLKQLCENEVLALVEGLVVGSLKLVRHVVQLVELLLCDVQRGLAGGVGLDHLGEIADFVIFFFIKLRNIVAAVLYLYIIVRRELFERCLDRGAAYSELLRDAAFADAAAGHNCEAYDILQNKLVYDIVERHERISAAYFLKLLDVHNIISCFVRYNVKEYHKRPPDAN